MRSIRAAAKHRDDLAREMTLEEVAAALRTAPDWVSIIEFGRLG